MITNNNLKKQINSINLILKIINAMKLITFIKIKKIEKKNKELNSYFSEIFTIFNNISQYSKNSIYYNHQKYPLKNIKTCWLIINSNLGLCGNYNYKINKLVSQYITKDDFIICIGKKANLFFNKNKNQIIHVYNNIDTVFKYEIVQELTLELLSNFNNKKFNKIKIAYTQLNNKFLFKPKIFELLPINQNQKINKNIQTTKINKLIIEFEPNANFVLENSILMYLNAIIYSKIIESQISEQFSRKIILENANNNASNMKEKLILKYNKQRQNIITQEILEIIAGVNLQQKK